MLKKTLIRLLIISTILFAATVISSTAQTRPEDSASDSRTIQVANERLAKTLDALEKSEALNKTLEALVEKQNQLLALNDEIIKKKESIIADQADLIAIYEKRKGTTISFFFGLIKFRKQ
jgi:hypothetical protein